VIVVNPNLCFDRTMRIYAFEAGTVSRPVSVAVTPGGKGVNVLRTARDLGRAGTLVGLVAEQGGARLLQMLAAEGIELVPVAIDGEVRAAVIVLEDSGRATVLNEPGPETDESDLARLVLTVERELSGTPGPLICSGSLPPGLPTTTHGEMVTAAHRQGRVAIVDAAREALVATLPFGPDVITPNLAEAEGIVTGAVTESVDSKTAPLSEVRARAEEAAAGLLDRGARNAVVTAGGHGVCLAQPTGLTWIAAHRVNVANPIGAGDSFTSGLAVALDSGQDLVEAARFATAVAGAAVEDRRAGHVDADRVRALHGSEVARR
jgi:1-phosphofructokinase family hexose kinase